MRFKPLGFGCLAVLIVVAPACTTTSVKKNPGEHDRGVRYYRPKPYLLVQPTTGKSDDFVTISLEYLPDFTEEYSIHVRAGLGINKTKISLKDGWNLTQLDMELDANVDDNIKAVGDLLKSTGEFAKNVRTGGETATRMVLKSNNVPLGYYESVISRGCEGKKRLYGWRYVGFAPFNQCPLDSGGKECTHCEEGRLFALVVREGAMTFMPIGMIDQVACLQRCKVEDAPNAQADLDAAQSYIDQNEKTLTENAEKFAKSASVQEPKASKPTVKQLPYLDFEITYAKGTTLPAGAAENTQSAISNWMKATGYKARVTLKQRTQ